jgi:tRNA threonylcarbamoyladenosine biosynthesis protein TsaB
MRVLAIDTSSLVLGVAVLDETGQGVEFNYSLDLRHASHLVPTIEKALSFSGLELKDVDAYCVSVGPGSFTGLRIGVSAIKALWLANKKKVVAVPTLDVLARNIPKTDDTICVVVDAKKDKFYARFYKYEHKRHCEAECSEDEAISKRDCFVPAGLPLVVGPPDLLAMTPALLVGRDDLLKRLVSIKNDILLTGDGIEKLSTIHYPLSTKKLKFTTKDFWYPRAINAARIGLEMARQGKVVKDVDALVPLYLHPKDVQCRK